MTAFLKLKKIFFIVGALFILILGLTVTASEWIHWPAEWLNVPDEIEKADCLVVLRGDDYFRFERAVELYQQGLAPAIILSVIPEKLVELSDYYNFSYRIYKMEKLPEDEFALRAFEVLGKDREGILFTDGATTSTFDEAVATRNLMLKKGFRSLILVTSTYHMRRSLAIFKSVFKGTGIKIYHSMANNILYDSERWWEKERDVKRISEEYFSCLFNWVYHFVLGKGNTDFDTV